MKTRAAVAYAAGKPLEIVTVDLEGPRAGEVLVELKATGVCHTDQFHPLRRRPGGPVPGNPRPRRCRHRRRRRRGRHRREAGRPRDPALYAGMPAVQSCTSRKTNLCTAIRATQGRGVMPDGTSRFSIDKQKVHHYMAARRSRTTPCCRRSRLPRSARTPPFDKVCYIGARVTTASARSSTPPRSRRAPMWSCSGSAASAST